MKATVKIWQFILALLEKTGRFILFAYLFATAIACLLYILDYESKKKEKHNNIEHNISTIENQIDSLNNK